MKKINPLELFFWTFRRNEKDVVNLYDSLSDLMRIATGGDMLNFGYWENVSSPIQAQANLCKTFGSFVKLEPNHKILDVGSGLASPALQWQNDYSPISITSVNINFNQLSESYKQNSLNFLNSTATTLPFESKSFDRVLALESAQHFNPLESFFSESFRILKKDGLLGLAIPVTSDKTSMRKLGLLSMTWSSEHYTLEFVKSTLHENGFEILEMKKIGSNIYEPLTEYYSKNREEIKEKILKKYPSYVEKILFKSLIKMKELSEKKLIDYLLISCKKSIQ